MAGKPGSWAKGAKPVKSVDLSDGNTNLQSVLLQDINRKGLTD